MRKLLNKNFCGLTCSLALKKRSGVIFSHAQNVSYAPMLGISSDMKKTNSAVSTEFARLNPSFYEGLCLFTMPCILPVKANTRFIMQG